MCTCTHAITHILYILVAYKLRWDAATHRLARGRGRRAALRGGAAHLVAALGVAAERKLEAGGGDAPLRRVEVRPPRLEEAELPRRAPQRRAAAAALWRPRRRGGSRVEELARAGERERDGAIVVQDARGVGGDGGDEGGGGGDRRPRGARAPRYRGCTPAARYGLLLYGSPVLRISIWFYAMGYMRSKCSR